MATANKKNTYDIIITGSGLSGLILAKLFANLGKKVLVLEARETAGGHLNKTSTKEFEFKTSLEFVPDFKEYVEPFVELEQLLDKSVLGPSKEVQPKTFNSGELKDFVGFGDLKFHSIDEAQWYTQSKIRELLSGPEDWIEDMFDEPNFEILTLHQVTRYNFEEGQFRSVTVNGSKTFFADQFFHTAPLTLLNQLLSDEAVKPKEKTRLAKAQGWTSICLHLMHRGLQTENTDVHVLMGSKTDFEPCVGRFFPATQKDGQTYQESIWMSLINDEYTEDMEFIGSTLRQIKKQVKRAYPEAVENAESVEKIVVTPQGQGFVDLKFKNPVQISQVPNFWLASPLMYEQRGVGASVQAAFAAFNAWEELQPETAEITQLTTDNVADSEIPNEAHDLL